jgi:predicted metal-dependent hydrolase
MAIHVFADRPVELRAPLKCPWKEIESFLQNRREWIFESLESLAGIDVPQEPRFVEGETHFFLGVPRRLRLVEGSRRNVSIVGDTMAVRCSRPGDAELIRDVLENFYRTEAKRFLAERLPLCRERFRESLPESTLRVRKMRARWGSCSPAGEICLNTLLMQKSVAAIDFVVTHELCHLKHFAHNRSFYRLMDRTMPDWREREKLLETDKGRLQLDLF